MAAISIDGTPMTALPADADQINYDNTSSGMAATQVQAAVDELNSNKQPKTDNNLQTTSKETTGAINELKSGLTSVTNIVNGNRTKLGTVALLESLEIPRNKSVLYFRVNINNYYYSPMYVISSNLTYVTFGIESWGCNILLQIDGTTNRITFQNENTIAGNKSAGWTTKIDIYYT